MRPLCALYALFFTFLLNSQSARPPQRCTSERNIQEINSNPKLLKEYDKLEQIVKDHKKKYFTSNVNQRLIDPNGLITIPVVVHVIHLPNHTVGIGTNISLAQIQTQIDVLNEDFSRTNADAVNTPNPFLSAASNVQIAFRLACYDPNGASTDGVTRTPRSISSSFWNNSMKTATGGHESWATDRYLNIWVVPFFDDFRTLAQTQPIGSFSTNPTTDGIAVRYDCIGRGSDYRFKKVEYLSTSFQTVIRTWDYNLGRTVTHEVGHWLNLVHIWGPNNGGIDQNCDDSDLCDDTPNQRNPSDDPYIVKSFPFVSCSNGPNGDMFMNFMDYSDDKYMNTFTNDQKIRMRAVFQPGGPRQGFIDNYFKLVAGPRNCSFGIFVVRTPFCEAQDNIQWTISGGGSFLSSSNPNGALKVVSIPNLNGEAIITASWNNFISDISIPIGYGAETSTYNRNFNNSGNIDLRVNGVHTTSSNNWTYGQVAFSNATGVAKNWRIVSSTSPAFISTGNSNSFSVFITQPYNFVKVRAEIPTACGDKTIEYSFLASYLTSSLSFALSPNPASNNITIAAARINTDPNARTTSEVPEYEVQIFTRYSQLMKKMKCDKGMKDITIDVSNLPSNQLYTVKLISSEGVDTKSFFKE